MKSPFPGMDPFIEMSFWPDFQSTFNPHLREMLVPRVDPKYFVAIEDRVYIERFDESEPLYKRPDVVVVRGVQRQPPLSEAVTTIDPNQTVKCVLKYAEEVTETYLVIKDTQNHEVVTVIETLSPANKRPGMDGHQEYATKRDLVIYSQANFVEIDLLRGGQRPEVARGRPPADYYVLISRASMRPHAEYHAWTLRQRMLTINIPLLDGESVSLDLQQAFATVYERARYDRRIDDSKPLIPPVSEDDGEWIKSITA